MKKDTDMKLKLRTLTKKANCLYTQIGETIKNSKKHSIRCDEYLTEARARLRLEERAWRKKFLNLKR